MRVSDVKELTGAFWTADGYCVCNGHEVYGEVTSCRLYIAGYHKNNPNLIAVIGRDDRSIRFYLEKNAVYKTSPADRKLNMKIVQLPKRFGEKYPELVGKVKALRYARNAFNEPVGVALVNDEGFAGYSMLNVRMGDCWDAIKGIRKALYRTAQKKTVRDYLKEFQGSLNRSPAYRENVCSVAWALSCLRSNPRG